jgi:hypothetical protein
MRLKRACPKGPVHATDPETGARLLESFAQAMDNAWR